MIILAFALTFAVIGWVSPMVYTSNVPQGQVIEVHEFSAQNATSTADDHFICFDRTVHKPATAETFTELYMIGEDGTRIEVDSRKRVDYFEGGNRQVVQSIPLPDELAEGEYKYVFVANFDLADGRVERTFAFESESFYVNDSVDRTTHEEAVKQCG
jgi:hypothetical protein